MTESGSRQELWAGKFGDEYAARSPGTLSAAIAMMARIFQHRRIDSAIELGAGTGGNLRALRSLFPGAQLAAVEINAKARERIDASVELFGVNVLEFRPKRQWDLAFTRGLLIHIHPEHLESVYRTLHRAAVRYVMLAEYYRPTPTEIEYRGEGGRMWARNFAGELIATYPDLRLIDYGFIYHGDPGAPQDDLTWFLMEKKR